VSGRDRPAAALRRAVVVPERFPPQKLTGAALMRGRVFDDGRMEWTFTGQVIEWRGPAPYLFVAMSPEDSEDLKKEARGLIYWGVRATSMTRHS
jgi:hypothetical protein